MSDKIIRRSFEKKVSYCDKGRTRIVKILNKIPFSEGGIFVRVEPVDETAESDKSLHAHSLLRGF